MSIRNLIFGVNSVTVSYLLRYDSLLQNATEGITKCNSFITKRNCYYKMGQFYYKMRQLLQCATFITNCDSTKAFESFESVLPKVSFELWEKDMASKSAMFQFWNLILQTELKVLHLIRSMSEKKLKLYISCLESLMFLFFALDH